MKPSLLKTAALGAAAKLGMVKLQPEFPFKDMGEIHDLQRQSILDQLDAFKKHGIKWYRIAASGNACPCCREHDGEEFRVDEAVFGVTLPPFCDRCRCSIIQTDNE